MIENMISTAGSKDPAQQHLREQKKIWNQSVRSLIAKLIAFKRGVSGRGDPKAGLPASQIQEPLPAEIGSFMDQISMEYAAIIDGAAAIIQEQQHYSEVRRKPQPKQNSAVQMFSEQQAQPQAAADDGLVVEASWLGSRMWANLFGIRGKGRKHIVEMLDKSNEIRKSLEDLENILTSSNPNAISSAVNEAGALGFSSVKLLLEEFYALDKLVNSKQDLPPSPDKNQDTKSDEKNTEIQPTQEPIAHSQESEEPSEIIGTGGGEEQDIQKLFFQYLSVFDLIRKDVIQSNAPMQKARNINPTPEIVGLIDTLSGTPLSLLVFKATKQIKLAKMNENYEQAVKYLKELVDEYIGALTVCSQLLGVAIPADQINSYTGFKYLNSVTLKNKEASVKSYLKKKWMKFVNNIVSDKTDSMKISVLDTIVVCLDNLNILMNTLETPGSQPAQIESDLRKMLEELKKLYLSIITLAELHNTEREQELINKKRKDINLFEIKEKSILRLKDTYRLIDKTLKK